MIVFHARTIPSYHTYTSFGTVQLPKTGQRCAIPEKNASMMGEMGMGNGSGSGSLAAAAAQAPEIGGECGDLTVARLGCGGLWVAGLGSWGPLFAYGVTSYDFVLRVHVHRLTFSVNEN